VLVTATLFAGTLSVRGTIAWFSYLEEQLSIGEALQASEFFNETLTDMMENWQSEFLQLIWQVSGLAFLWYVACPQSKSESERIEQKIDAIERRLDSQRAERLLNELGDAIQRNRGA
jgi:hypothetical protein